MSTAAVPSSANEALELLQALLGVLATQDAADLPAEVLAESLRTLEHADAVGSALRGRFLEAFDAQEGHGADGQRTARTWLVHTTRVTKGQAAEHVAVQKLAQRHPVLLAALAEGDVLTKSVALQLAKWTRAIPDEFRGRAEEILVAAARAGADLRALAEICAEIRSRTAPPDPDGGPDPGRGVSLETTLEGAGVLRGELTPGCAAMVRAVLDALSAPQGGGDLRARPQRYHDALEEAMRRLLACGLLPRRAGQPVKALVHVSFADLCDLERDSVLQDKWITEYRARWAAQRAAASVSTGDGGAWLEGDAARRVACDAMIIPVVTGDLDPAAVEDLIVLCVRYHRLRTQGPGTPDGATSAPATPDGATSAPATPDGATSAPATPDPAAPDGASSAGDTSAVPAGLISQRAEQAAQAAAALAEQAALVAAALDDLEQQIIAKVLTVVSGPAEVASFLMGTWQATA